MDKFVNAKLRKGILAFFLFCSAAGFAQSQSTYENMLKVIGDGSHEVGHCLVSLEIDPVDSNALVVVTEHFGTAEASEGQLKIQNPNKTRGEAVITFDKEKRVFSHRQSDFFGWTHLDLGLDTQGQISKLSIFKTRPDGQVYLKIVTCE